MARSYHVWVVMGCAPLATFTVKHECEAWMGKVDWVDFEPIVFRFKDGGGSGRVQFKFVDGALCPTD